jgi:murein DD-endopeptidase MepM/ murein hydrolase activator NlpD
MSKKFVSALCVILAILFVVSLVVMVLPSSAGAVSQSQIDALQAQKEQLAAKKKAASDQISTLKSQQAGYLEQKEALDEKCEIMRQDIALLEKQITLYDGMIEQEGEELAAAEKSRDEQLVRYRTRVRAMEENGKYNYFEVLFSATSLSDLLSKMDDIGEIMQSDKDLEDSYKASVAQCQELKAQYETTQSEMKNNQTELKSEKVELEAQITEAADMIASLQGNIDEFTTAYEENEAAEKQVISQMNKLSAQLAAEAAAEKKKQQQQQTSGKTTTTTTTAVTGSGSFKWPVPSCTYITSRYGYRVHPIFHTTKFHSGLDIAASAGSTICAADAGTVAVATYSSSYGNYVMINHANGYTTLYAHMSSLAVSAGQTVSKGTTIGYVGSTGWSTGPHCHFEIRYNGSTVDPAQYFSGLSYSADA